MIEQWMLEHMRSFQSYAWKLLLKKTREWIDGSRSHGTKKREIVYASWGCLFTQKFTRLSITLDSTQQWLCFPRTKRLLKWIFSLFLLHNKKIIHRCYVKWLKSLSQTEVELADTERDIFSFRLRNSNLFFVKWTEMGGKLIAKMNFFMLCTWMSDLVIVRSLMNENRHFFRSEAIGDTRVELSRKKIYSWKVFDWFFFVLRKINTCKMFLLLIRSIFDEIFRNWSTIRLMMMTFWFGGSGSSSVWIFSVVRGKVIIFFSISRRLKPARSDLMRSRCCVEYLMADCITR